MSQVRAAAQSNNGPAEVRSVKGAVKCFNGGPAPFLLKRGDPLQPGYVIETGNGLVTIALDDGSQVIIFPGSRVILKDFAGVGTWRDLLQVAVGRVRATINHAKRINPYRVYSPIASIAVRGTDFLVDVNSRGETRVVVYEGLVEVSSLLKPQHTVLVRPGRNIIVRPDGDISLVTAAPRSELNEIRNLRVGTYSYYNDVFTAYTSHQENYANLRPSRFTAFNDSHLDSLQNPAYATEFRQSSGRLYLAPSFSPEVERSYDYAGPDPPVQPETVNLFNYTLSPQLSYFAPLGSRVVVGGGAAVTKTDLGVAENEVFYDDVYSHSVERAKFTTANMSLVAARRFGQKERTSVGVKLDYMVDRSSYLLDVNWSADPGYEHNKHKALARRIGLSAGLTHDLGGDKKLGIYYRYSAGHVRNRFTRGGEETFGNGADTFDRQPGHGSELGFLFRGSLTERLFYGVEGLALTEQGRDESNYSIVNRRAKHGRLGVGMGYALGPRTVLSLDLSAGRALGNRRKKFIPTPGGSTPDHYNDERSSFWSLHGGGQTDLRRNLFVSGSVLIVRERDLTNWGANEVGHYALQSTYQKYTSSNFSVGWRAKPNWVVQYVYFTRYGRHSEFTHLFRPVLWSDSVINHWRNPPSHSLILRYEFGDKKERIK